MKYRNHSHLLDNLNQKKNSAKFFERFSQKASEFTGSTFAFIIAVALILAWIFTGPFFNYSNTWQLVINTTTTIVTFLMVFLIQRTQNKDSRAVHLKLNELVASSQASNRLIDVEGLSEQELKTLSSFYFRLSEMAKKEANLTTSHSIEEAEELHRFKYKKHRPKNFRNNKTPQQKHPVLQKERQENIIKPGDEQQEMRQRHRHYRKSKKKRPINPTQDPNAGNNPVE
jgi:low affinity Fe/Cu permease